jgi:hypothetical protein
MSSVPAGKWLDITSRPLPSKSFPVYQSTSLSLNAMYMGGLRGVHKMIETQEIGVDFV